MRRRQERNPRPFDPALRDLARAVHGDAHSEVERKGPPSAELCVLGVQLADALHVYERRGGTAHITDVVGQPPFADHCSIAESQTTWPRPTGRWEIVLRRDIEVERVIGEAGGSWYVEGLLRLKAFAQRDGVIGIDEPGSEEGLALPAKSPNQDLKNLSHGADVAGRVSVVTSGPATEAYLMSAALDVFGRVVGDRPPRWHVDPSERHDMRFWNGDAWTRFVFDARG